MNGVDRVKAICRERKIALSKLERDLGYGNGYIGQLRKGVFPSDRLIEIAEYLQISPTYILTGAEKSAPADGGKHAFGENMNLTQTELDLLHKFRQLDERGRSAVLHILDHEYTSITGEETISHPRQA